MHRKVDATAADPDNVKRTIEENEKLYIVQIGEDDVRLSMLYITLLIDLLADDAAENTTSQPRHTRVSESSANRRNKAARRLYMSVSHIYSCLADIQE